MEHVELLREKARRLPAAPGVYLMRDASGEIIYVGKAKALRNRVSGYFRSLDKHHPKVLRMVCAARDFETIVTSSEFEALVLECSMIKQYRPKYNILLKDDKGYHYVRVSGGEYPRVSAEKTMDAADGSRWLGPYTSSFVVNQTVDEVNKAFMLPVCHRRFPEDFGRERPCLNYHIKQCCGLCRGKITKQEYAETIEQAVDFITRGGSGALNMLREKMSAAAEALDFEKAAFYRDRIAAIRRMNEHQNVVFAKAADQDVAAIVQNAKDSCIALLKIRNQRLVDKQVFQLGEIESLQSARADFLLSYYGNAENTAPPVILLDGACADMELVQRYLRERRSGSLALRTPSRGEGARLTQMALANAAQHLAHKIERTGKELSALDELARLLGLSRPPIYIEAYDVSNYGEQTVVGGMVIFENGRPLKSAYRKFNMKAVQGVDDYGSLREMISRRFLRYEEERESGDGFGRLPDLILLDGGRGHVGVIEPLLRGMGIGVPVFGMVKDSSHRTRAIAQGGGEIAIASVRSAFALVSRIQEEVHRFAISHMKKHHKKASFDLRLTGIPGIGEKRAAALIKAFKTQKALAGASAEELAKVPGMSVKAAKAVFEFFRENDIARRKEDV